MADDIIEQAGSGVAVMDKPATQPASPSNAPTQAPAGTQEPEQPQNYSVDITKQYSVVGNPSKNTVLVQDPSGKTRIEATPQPKLQQPQLMPGESIEGETSGTWVIGTPSGQRVVPKEYK